MKKTNVKLASVVFTLFCVSYWQKARGFCMCIMYIDIAMCDSGAYI